MKPFPFSAVLLLLLGALPFPLIGGWIFLAGVFTPLPHLSVVLLAYGACILSFLGAIHWGLAAERPDIITIRGTAYQDRQRIILGFCPLLWGWIALCIGLMSQKRFGYVLEGLGFILMFGVERIAARQGALPPGFLLVKGLFTVLAVAGLLLAALSLQGNA